MDPSRSAHLALRDPTPADALAPDEPLLVVRAGPWRLLVPLRHVDRVHPAALPAARPAAARVAPVLALDGELWPVAFAEALLGAAEVRLAPAHQLIALRHGGRRGLLWVDAVEDVVPHTPVAPPPGAGAGGLVAGWSGAGGALAVLDVPAVLAGLAEA